MLFNSFDFLIFLPVVFVLYWFVFPKNLKVQNMLIMLASYVFYGWWNWRFLGLIIFSSIVDWTIGLKLSQAKKNSVRKGLLALSLLINLGLLGFFKYCNFFIDSFSEIVRSVGLQVNPWTLEIILPVGISFYTFQTLSYTIDIYRKKIEPTRDIIAFFAFVSFFPQLVAGPIERASRFLPQFGKKRVFDSEKAVDGLRQILWGGFKKVVIADNCAEIVNVIFNNNESFGGSTLLLGAILFGFQIYGDFSGYSDIAIGTSRLFGFSLMQNFAFPYFSRDIAEFWRRWHISLSTWFRDYVYIPLGGNAHGFRKHIRNIMITFLVSGFWHGANWTFLVWGLINGLLFIPIYFMGKQYDKNSVVAEGRILPSGGEAVSMLLNFTFVTLAWIFFRADSMSHAFSFLSGVFNLSLFSLPSPSHLVNNGIGLFRLLTVLCFIAVLLVQEWTYRTCRHGLDFSSSGSRMGMLTVYLGYVWTILLFGNFNVTEFIYFQF